MRTVKEEFGTLKKLILFVLENYPETRNSDNTLFIECAKQLGANTLEDLNSLELNMISVHKLRQHIQNKEGKFLPNDEVKAFRNERKKDVRDYFKKAN